MLFRRKNPQNERVGDDYTDLREKMVDEQIRKRGVKDKRVLEVMRKVPRHLFVDPDSMERCLRRQCDAHSV